jgi:pyruvate kinase
LCAAKKDVHDLQQARAKVGGEHLGIILKIETRAAFECLPRLLLASMKSQRFGVMIARGDLAVECGYERTAEVQEEILWICEGAHTPGETSIPGEKTKFTLNRFRPWSAKPFERVELYK